MELLGAKAESIGALAYPVRRFPMVLPPFFVCAVRRV